MLVVGDHVIWRDKCCMFDLVALVVEVPFLYPPDPDFLKP